MCSPTNKELILEVRPFNNTSSCQPIVEAEFAETKNQQNLQATSTTDPKVQEAAQSQLQIFWSTHPAYTNLSTRAEAECQLKFLPVGSWLIRYSSTEKREVVSYKDASHTIRHKHISYQENAANLEQQFGYYSQIHFFRDILSYLNQSNPFCKKISAVKPKYDYQLQLDLGSGITARHLEERSQSKEIESCTLSLKQTEQELDPLLERITRLTHDSRLYLIGHTCQGASKLTSETKPDQTHEFEWTTLQIANLLFNNASHLIKKDQGDNEQHLKISLVACHAGLNGERNHSFAVQLSKILAHMNIPAEILARTHNVNIQAYRRFQKEVNGRHHGLGDKVSVVTRNGQTTIQVVSYE